ncbi:MAG TPA: hypothetical protein VFB23_01195 [Candidatus Acidoferrales bacterium]|nr:hypothetical protein [Candidatus Acidoferrales bacterium]
MTLMIVQGFTLPAEILPPPLHAIAYNVSGKSENEQMESAKPTDSWTKTLAGGTLTFTGQALGNPPAAYVYEAKFERGTSSYSMSRQSTEALSREEVEQRFADFISEIRHGQ